MNNESEMLRSNAELRNRVAKLEDAIVERKQAVDSLYHRTEQLTALLRVSQALSATARR